MNSKQFRDPQVIRYNGEAGKYWVMSVAKSHQYKIQFYKSTNLKNWKPIGSFSLYGFLGYQYECPNLAKMQYTGNQTTWLEKVEKEVEGETSKNYLWVLFISINPGSMQGGSSTQYFIGNFDGTNFTPIKNYAAPIDYGKDFYALQLFFNSPDGDIYGVAWASNWQYCATVPTDNWRSSMSLVRRLTIDDFESAKNTKIAFIKSEPITEINNGKLRYGEKTYTFNSNEQKLNAFYPTYTVDISDEVSGALEFTCNFTVYGERINKPDIHPHMLRNNFAKRFLMSGGDIYTLSKILGHSSVQVTEQCYLDLKTEDLRQKYQNYSPLLNLKQTRGRRTY